MPQRTGSATLPHGAKDGHPYPVNRTVHDGSVEWVRDPYRKAIWQTDKLGAVKRLANWQ
jgi:hypothetical protein